MRSHNPLGPNPASAESYLPGTPGGQADRRLLRPTGMKDILAWVAAHHPEIDLSTPPIRQAPVGELEVANGGTAS